jgi:hypothetical protein
MLSSVAPSLRQRVSDFDKLIHHSLRNAAGDLNAGQGLGANPVSMTAIAILRKSRSASAGITAF